MSLTYRGIVYNTDHTVAQPSVAALTYRGKSYSHSAKQCKRVQWEETYRGAKHTVSKLICA